MALRCNRLHENSLYMAFLAEITGRHPPKYVLKRNTKVHDVLRHVTSLKRLAIGSCNSNENCKEKNGNETWERWNHKCLHKYHRVIYVVFHYFVPQEHVIPTITAKEMHDMIRTQPTVTAHTTVAFAPDHIVVYQRSSLLSLLQISQSTFYKMPSYSTAALRHALIRAT